MARTFFYLFSILLSFLWLSPQVAIGAHQITGVRYWSAPDHTRVVLDINEALPYKTFTLANPHRFVVDCKDTATSFPPETIPVNDAVVRKIRLGQFKKDVLRIVFDLVQPVEAKLSIADESQEESRRLVIELFRPDLKAQDVETPAPVDMGSQSDNKKIIVIDPGHGGDDPGAVGPRGTLEKDVVLGFARSLKEAFDEKGGYQVYLTRNGDYFLPLRDRVSMAEEYEADLFISVHADSNRIKKTRGSSVYCLSLKGASDEAARCLAEKENASDLIGGIPFSENEDLNFTLLDLALTNTINSSLRFGALVLREVKKVNPIRFDKPKQAGFKVLKTAETPSILIELGFISNPTEERLLKEKKFQATVAQAIFSASHTFFDFMASNESLREYRRSAKTSGETVSFHQR
jgi:N-acetylmuramoyl-L-alanine amidase